jgi:SAM-dependent methyltransferase
MKRKDLDNNYYQLQNGRSGMDFNANSIDRYQESIPIKLGPGVNVLDIGCRAKARTVLFFHKNQCNSYGIDIGANAENEWRNHPLKGNLKRADIHNGVPFDVKFDIISISHTLEHCHTPELVLKHIHDALKENGYVWGIVPVEPVSNNQDPNPHYCIFHSHDEHIDMYKNNGFEVIWDSLDSSKNSHLWAKKI